MLLLGAARLIALGGQTLETIGRARVKRPGAAARAELLRETCVRICDRQGFSVEVEGAIPRGPAVFVSNHVSYMDPVVIGSLLPCVVLAKSEIAEWPVVGACAQALGVIFVKRGDVYSGARALRSALRSLRSGIAVLGFPEGTTSRDQLLPFQRGLFGLARLAGVPVIPLALEYDDPATAWVGDEWFLPHYVRTAMRPRTHASLHVGAPVDCSAASRREASAARARSHIATLLRKTA